MTPRKVPETKGKDLDSAVRKLESKEAKTKTTPTPSVGREVRRGQIENA